MLIQRVSNLEFNQWASLRNAIDQLIANGTYDQFVRIHSEGRHRMHGWTEVGTQRFLPWHRAYLIIFERELRNINPSLSIPYWDWVADGGALRGFSNAEWSGLWRRTPANERGTLPFTEDEIQRILRQTNYTDFTTALESGGHNRGHVWVGGDMATMASPTDPAFWFHHAQVDHIWALWQRKYPNEMADLSEADEQLDPWNTEFTIDSVNNLYDLGQDSYRYVEPNTTRVSIPDTALQAAVRSELGLASDAPITAQALKRLTRLYANESTIRDLTGLEDAINLQELSLAQNQIDTVQPLAGLGNLRILYLVNNTIAHIQPLSGLTNLQQLYLGRNRIRDVRPLAGLTNLQELGLAHNNIGGIDPLRRFVGLQRLYLRNSNIRNLQPLAGLVNLRRLNLRDNDITDVGPLSGLTNLNVLHLSGNPNLRNTSPLANLNVEIDVEITVPTPYVYIRTLQGHTEGIESLAFSTDGSQLASSSRDGTIRLWNPNTGELLRTLRAHTGPVHSVAFRPGAFELASVGDRSGNHTIRKWDTNTGGTHIHGRHLWAVTVAYHPQGHTLASGASGSAAPNTIKLWDSGYGTLKRTLNGHTDSVLSVAFSPDGHTLASGSYDQTIRLWDPNNGRHIATLNGHTDAVYSVAFSPDGRMLASGSYDQTIRLWDLNTKRTVRVLQGPGGYAQVTSVAFHPDGHTLASGHLHGNNLHLWNLNTGERITTLTGHTWNVISVAFSPSGMLASGGGNDDTIRLWESQPVPDS